MMKLALLLCLLTLSAAEAARHRGRRAQPRQPSASRGAEQQSSPSLERVLTVEDHRFPHDQFLLATLRNGGGKGSRAALVAIGRIGDPYALEDITRLLDKKDREMRRLGIFALSLMNDDTSLKVLMQNLPMQRDPEVLAALLVAVGRAGGEQTMIPLANALKDDSSGPLILEGATHGLGLLWAGNSEKWIVPQVLLQRLARLALGPDPVGTSAAFALARYKGDVVALPVPDLMEGSMKAVTPSIRAFFLRALGRLKTPLVAQFLANLYTPVQPLEVRIEVVRALGTQNSTEAILTTLRKALSDPASSVVVTALESIGSISSGAAALADGVDGLASSAGSTWVRGTALKALAKIQPTLARTRITPLLSQPTSPVFPYAVGALGNLANQDELVKLAELTNSPNLKAAQEALEAFGTFSEDRITPPMKIELKKALERGDTALASLVAQLVEKLKWKDFAPSLATVYRLLAQPDQLEGKVAVLNALAVVGTADYTELLDIAMNDPDRQVVAAAAGAYKAITGKDMSARVPLNSKVNAPAVRMAEVNAALRSEVVLKTTRGEIVLHMNEVAPLNATNFVKLVRRGFYDGKPFHRVVPDFVTQGGDPRGDGYGGPGYFVRDEVSWLKHERGTVGIATSGKDTGGCQFFFNLAPNLHLDGRYTLFAKIVRGLEVADALEVGDRIITARVR